MAATLLRLFIEPRLLVAGYPRAFENPNPEEAANLKEPSLPTDYDTLSGEAKVEADELHRQRLLSHYYHVFNGGLNKAHLSALRDPPPSSSATPCRQGREAIEWRIDDLERSLNPADLEQFIEKQEPLFHLNAALNMWSDQLGGASENGWISNEN
ncbi:hypothetical protein BDV36DRAFT_292621 [Aspergillus pseudocaelatus]|uniref:Uncharacterized protein n=1 Tax=Aspergillus pseudocaelatus TaxID=1825620 RepID=A0ABQ6WVR1_9EURO|nr:hypothetical protein BDV36DRAFT_292621 [Aspergillus pseudocaelatus]